MYKFTHNNVRETMWTTVSFQSIQLMASFYLQQRNERSAHRKAPHCLIALILILFEMHHQDLHAASDRFVKAKEKQTPDMTLHPCLRKARHRHSFLCRNYATAGAPPNKSKIEKCNNHFQPTEAGRYAL